jgi:hypothetical protein
MGADPEKDAIVDAGQKLQLLTERELKVAGAPTLESNGELLSAGLASAHNAKASAANNFATTKDDGILAAGRKLQEFGMARVSIDEETASAIEQPSREPRPDTGGGR